MTDPVLTTITKVWLIALMAIMYAIHRTSGVDALGRAHNKGKIK